MKLLPKNKYFLDINIGASNSTILSSPNKYQGILIRSTRKIDKNFLDKCNFELIASFTRGVDHIDIEYAEEKGITILYSDGANCISAAEHTLALILEIYKKIKYSDSLIRKGKFADTNFERRELSGKTIGIIGIGKVGSYVVKLAKAFGMKVVANDIDIKVRRKYKNLDFRNFEYICKNCDIISLHIPLNKNNNNFISNNKLKLLQKDSILINTSRGKILDENYLIKLLEKKKIKFAGLDVFNNEPHISKRFFGLENVILTNHIAGKTIESKSKIAEEIILKIKNFYLKC